MPRITWKPRLGYSTNVHPGENLDAVRRSLRQYTGPIRERVYGDDPAGLELRLGIGSARDLESKHAREEFRELLDELRLELFSVNAYPLSDFHARRVKEIVYQPSWAESARATWTSRIGRIVSDLVEPGEEISISTLGGAFRRQAHGPVTFRKLAKNYLRTCRDFLDITAASGCELILAVEPEPETTFETAGDVIEFFEGYLLPLAIERWKRRGTRARIESDLRRVFTLNVDTCHLSVLFEDQVQSLRQLEKAGLRVGKVHVTNAVSLRNPWRSPEAYRDLRQMHEPKYFHQFCAIDRRGQIAWRELDLADLPRKLVKGEHPEVVEARSHFHVPLYLKRYKRLHTTRDDTVRALAEVVKKRSCRHLVFETYTWPLLTEARDRRAQLIRGITREWKFLLETLRDLRVRV